MKDVLGRDINVGDHVGITVGVNIVTGKVVRFRHDRNGYEKMKIALDKPEGRGGTYKQVYDKKGNPVMDEEKSVQYGYPYSKYEYIERTPRLTREVYGEEYFRILLIKEVA